MNNSTHKIFEDLIIISCSNWGIKPNESRNYMNDCT